MKCISIIILFLLAGCGTKENQNKKNPTGPDSLKVNVRSNKTNVINRSNDTALSGCNLVKYKFPAFWKTDVYNRIDSLLPYEREMENLYECFNELNERPFQKTSIKITDINRILLDSSEMALFENDTTQKDYLDSCKYQNGLTDGYSCFYTYTVLTKGSIGLLVIYDSTAKISSAINVFYERYGDQNVKNRYFFLQNQFLEVIDISCYDDGCSLVNRYNITIGSPIKIERLVNN